MIRSRDVAPRQHNVAEQSGINCYGARLTAWTAAKLHETQRPHFCSSRSRVEPQHVQLPTSDAVCALLRGEHPACAGIESDRRVVRRLNGARHFGRDLRARTEARIEEFLLRQ